MGLKHVKGTLVEPKEVVLGQYYNNIFVIEAGISTGNNALELFKNVRYKPE